MKKNIISGLYEPDGIQAKSGTSLKKSPRICPHLLWVRIGGLQQGKGQGGAAD